MSAPPGFPPDITVIPNDLALGPRALESADPLAPWTAHGSRYLAAHGGCELWTGRERCSTIARGAYPWVCRSWSG